MFGLHIADSLMIVLSFVGILAFGLGNLLAVRVLNPTDERIVSDVDNGRIRAFNGRRSAHRLDLDGRVLWPVRLPDVPTPHHGTEDPAIALRWRTEPMPAMSWPLSGSRPGTGMPCGEACQTISSRLTRPATRPRRQSCSPPLRRNGPSIRPSPGTWTRNGS